MAKIQIELPDATAKAAGKAGLMAAEAGTHAGPCNHLLSSDTEAATHRHLPRDVQRHRRYDR